ncbi:MAG TPA: ATP-binding protein [Myxococcota bacterium]|nr:ATP-binding protein [Myxococcota bacterium]HPC92698.1 ATP-binding protein [Myxococcota bacterium]HRR74299.1 ATP-binding protein [Myxococcota bacterium]HRV18610.1 ATP-binding protein [Myxococcota bacterium]
MDCVKCADTGYLVAPEGEMAVARVCDCQIPCPVCDDTRFSIDYSVTPPVTRPCGCIQLRKRIEKFNEAQIPARFHRSTLDNYEELAGNQAKIKMHFNRYRQAYEPGAKGLLLSGIPGVGKTHLICGLLRHLGLELNKTVRFVDFFNLLDMLKSSWNDDKGDGDIMNSLASVDVLAIDEMGKRPMTAWELSVLDQLISRRYNSRKTMFITTNLAIDTAGQSQNVKRRRLVDEVQERIYSRLIEMCDFLEVKGVDYRISKQ